MNQTSPKNSSPAGNPNAIQKDKSKLSLWPLMAATFFMVSGGAYGTEDIVHGAGYARTMLILVLTPLLWSLPTALMTGELASALPEEGGFYVWVRRAMGNFWGFQEAWLSLAASVFDMAIYPTLFVAYLTRMAPWFGIGHRGTLVGLGMILVCAGLNLIGARTVGLTSLWLLAVLSAPFALIVLLAPFHRGALAAGQTTPVTSTVGLLGGILIAMWNFMGWDSASTVAQEVEQPQKIYPRAMLGAVCLVTLSYLLPIGMMYWAGYPASAFETGSWADVAGLVGGNWLRAALVLGGMMSGFAMFNALLMSYSRLPLAMAQDGMLPRIFAKTLKRSRAPWVSILVCTAGWAACIGLGLERLVTLDVLLAGSSVVLEFIALAVLRAKEPDLKRPFRVPGGMPGAVLIGVCPTLLLILSAVRSEHEEFFGMNGFLFAMLIVVAGFVVYGLMSAAKHMKAGPQVKPGNSPGA